MIALPAVNWHTMRGSTEKARKLNGWLANRYVSGISPESECEFEAEIIIAMSGKIHQDKFKDWLMRYLYRTFRCLEVPGVRNTDFNQISRILAE